MAPFPFMPLLAIMFSLVSYMVIQMSVFSYVGFMVEYLGVVDNTDKAGETRTVYKVCILFLSHIATIRHSFGLNAHHLLLGKFDVRGGQNTARNLYNAWRSSCVCFRGDVLYSPGVGC